MKKYILFLLASILFISNINSQEKKLTIKVKDDKNKPVAGAIILFDNIKQRIWTNSSGVFKTKIKTEPKKISAFHPNIGIKTVKYNGENTIIINIFKGNDLKLSASSSKHKTINSDQYNTIYDYLRGKTPGVHVSSDNTIIIRGYNSINGNITPLFILNGTTISQDVFANIIPSDIKSVTVLKGPETTLYGVRGANGVIIVKTK